MELFTIYAPKTPAVSIVANLPHSGMFVPDDIAAQFTSEHLQSLPNTDWHLDKLYEFLPTLGITVLQATHSRYVVDLNRQLKEPVFGNFWTSVIPEQTAFGNPIYRTKPSREHIDGRIQKFYTPYHDKLKTILQEKVNKFGKVYLLDLHSFLGLITEEIDLGNGNGQTCSELLILSVEQRFLNKGYQVVKNKRFTGGYITRHYGQMPGVEALQIEVRYPVYLKEAQLDKLQPPDWDVPEFYAAKKTFDETFALIVDDLSAHTLS
jgi:N-formylglutamate amidohydrolase